MRTYLAVNCAMVHRPGGTGCVRTIELRYDTVLAQTNTVDVVPMAGGLGITNPLLVRPGGKEGSVLWERLRRLDAFRMPPLGSVRVDDESVTVIGYSVPPDDFQARTLLTSVLNSPQINRGYTLVDPDPAVGARYFQQISPKLRFVQAKFGWSLFPELLSQPGDVHHGVAPDPDRDLEL